MKFDFDKKLFKSVNNEYTTDDLINKSENDIYTEDFFIEFIKNLPNQKIVFKDVHNKLNDYIHELQETSTTIEFEYIKTIRCDVDQNIRIRLVDWNTDVTFLYFKSSFLSTSYKDENGFFKWKFDDKKISKFIKLAIEEINNQTSELNESGKSIPVSKPISGDQCLPIANKIISILKEQYSNINFTPLGSTGKKGKNQQSGDIDIGVEMDYNKAQEVENFLKTKIQNLQVNYLQGFHILSFGYPYNNQIVQCDLMFYPNLKLAQYFYHSPDFTKNESNFKGSIRNMLMLNILKNIPVQGQSDTTFENGHIKDHYKYSFNPEQGLVLLHQSFMGKKGQEIKTKKTIKEDTKVISSDTNYITQFMMGQGATDKTINSFESMVDWMNSDNFPYKDKNKQIFKDFYEYVERQSPEVLSNVQSYINKTISESVSKRKSLRFVLNS